MSLENEYRKYAASLLDLASKQLDSADKSRLLGMTEAWLDLADRITQRVKRRRATIDHPLVAKILGPDQPHAE
jgi:hypothetical protein